MTDKFTIFLFFILFAPITFGQSFIIPKPYKAIPFNEGNCVSLVLPKVVMGTDVCNFPLPVAEAAPKANLFELTGSKWLLIGPGIPIPAKIKELGQAIFCRWEHFLSN